MMVQLLLSLCVAYLTWSFITMEIKYQRASSMGIPPVRLPVDSMKLIWLVLEPSLWRLLDCSPFH